MHFDTRHYESYTLPAGMYDALRITIGNAKGHNWWCVMYPSICISTADEGKGRAKDVLSDDEYSLVSTNAIIADLIKSIDLFVFIKITCPLLK